MNRQVASKRFERRGPDLVSRVFEHLAGQGGTPRLVDLMLGLVTVMSDHSLVRGVAVSTDPVETGLLDPAWTRRVKPCLWDNHQSGTPEWISLPAGWLETASDEDLLGGELLLVGKGGVHGAHDGLLDF